jgi:uncharacterized protein (DUF305 family)
MNVCKLAIVAAGLMLLMPTTGCGARGAEIHSAPTSGAAPRTELEELYWARVDSARTHFTEADVHFLTAMIGHHAQAVRMTRMVPERAGSASIRTLAARIRISQEDEIALMQQWLGDRGQPAPQVDASGRMVQDHAHAHQHGMQGPGMLDEEQFERLAAARGAEFDTLFLRLMIEHHRGAVTMVHDLFATPGAANDPTVFKIASDIQVDQITEVGRMERMLAEMAAGTGFPGR